jgi:hypothetical protein
VRDERDEAAVARQVAFKMLDDLQSENQRLIRWLRSIADGGHDSAAARKAYRALQGEPFPDPWHPSKLPYNQDDEAS